MKETKMSITDCDVIKLITYKSKFCSFTVGLILNLDSSENVN